MSIWEVNQNILKKVQDCVPDELPEGAGAALHPKCYDAIQNSILGYWYLSHFDRELPIPPIAADEQWPYIELADRLQAAIAADPDFDNEDDVISDLNEEIDGLVYALYDLDEEETVEVEDLFWEGDLDPEFEYWAAMQSLWGNDGTDGQGQQEPSARPTEQDILKKVQDCALAASSEGDVAQPKYDAAIQVSLLGQWYQAQVDRAIAIPPIAAAEQQPYIDLVDRILDAKTADPDADTEALEVIIDCLVYALYDLSNEEMALVEDFFSEETLTEEE